MFKDIEPNGDLQDVSQTEKNPGEEGDMQIDTWDFVMKQKCTQILIDGIEMAKNLNRDDPEEEFATMGEEIGKSIEKIIQNSSRNQHILHSLSAEKISDADEYQSAIVTPKKRKFKKAPFMRQTPKSQRLRSRKIHNI